MTLGRRDLGSAVRAFLGLRWHVTSMTPTHVEDKKVPPAGRLREAHFAKAKPSVVQGSRTTASHRKVSLVKVEGTSGESMVFLEHSGRSLLIGQPESWAPCPGNLCSAGALGQLGPGAHLGPAKHLGFPPQK